MADLTARVAPKLRRLLDGEAPRVVDLFSGCGGMSLGFQRAGYEILTGIELDPVRARAHALNFHGSDDTAGIDRHAASVDVTVANPTGTVTARVGEVTAVDVLVGGPPCQAYARVGRAKLAAIAERPDAFKEDPRGKLYAAYLRWVEELAPVAVVMENVPDILAYGGENVAETIAEALEKLGYEARYTLLNAAWHGVPQMRERWYLLAVHRSARVIPTFPEPTHFLDLPKGYLGTRAHALAWGRKQPPHAVLLCTPPPDLPRAVSCEDALSDLPPIPAQQKTTRGRRDLRASLAYRGEPTTAYQRDMRKWPGRPSIHVTSHVIRYLPRDWETFRRMPPGAEYPAAWEVASARFQEALVAARKRGEDIPKESAAWVELRDRYVPPYDKDKFPNKWWKLHAKLPSRTLMAHLAHDSYSHIHYADHEARTISVREAARLQSFPDAFVFHGAMNTAFAQIGNAVPPLMAFALGSSLLARLRAAEPSVAPRPSRIARNSEVSENRRPAHL